MTDKPDINLKSDQPSDQNCEPGQIINDRVTKCGHINHDTISSANWHNCCFYHLARPLLYLSITGHLDQ